MRSKAFVLLLGLILILGVFSYFEWFFSGSAGFPAVEKNEEVVRSESFEEADPLAAVLASDAGKEEDSAVPSELESDVPGDVTKTGGAVAGLPVGHAAGNDVTAERDVLARLDRLELGKTIDVEWPEGQPKVAGSYPRIRIVETSFKTGLLRIEELVQFENGNDGLRRTSRSTLRAMDARHVLALPEYADSLRENGYKFDVSKAGLLMVHVNAQHSTGAIPQLLDELVSLGIVRVETDEIVQACALPSDPLVGQGAVWHLENLGLNPGFNVGADVGARDAWDTRTDASSVTIALLDSGITPGERELQSSLKVFPGETIGDGIDNDGNGYVDDVRGYDFYENDSEPQDVAGHGTVCSLLIGAEGNNGFGSSGIAWKASILNCKFMDGNGLGTLSDAIEAIRYARQSGASIINMSWAYFGDASVLREAMRLCDEEGILMVCASGNSGVLSPVPAPASIDLPHVISVASSTAADTISYFSVVDPEMVDLAAPGDQLCVMPDTGSQTAARYESGTSFSAALVSGALALAKAEFTAENSLEIKRRLLETTRPISGGAASLASRGTLDLGAMMSTETLPVRFDLFADRNVSNDPSGQWVGGNSGAGVEAIDASLDLPASPLRSIWFEWTASTSGVLRLGAEDSGGANATLTVFAESNGLPGSVLAISNESEVLELNVVEGQKLFWMIDSEFPAAGGLEVFWDLPPSNDNWSDAPAVTGSPIVMSGNSLGSTLEGREMNSVYFNRYMPLGTVWWKWTSDVSGEVKVAATANHLAFLLPLSGGRPNFVLEAEANGLYPGSYLVEQGTSYAVMVMPRTPAAMGRFDVAITGGDAVSIIAQPKNVAAVVGETVELRVEVVSASGLSYQWFKDSEAIPFATGPSLRFAPVVGANFGTYQVEVSAGTASVLSEAVSLSPRIEAPRAIVQSNRQTVVIGQRFTIAASFLSNSEMTYSWRKNGVLLPSKTSPTLSVVSIDLSDAGTYSLTATNAAGGTTVSIQVDIIETPWEGWVERTPGQEGMGRIFRMFAEGNRVVAFATSSCLTSDDGGVSWKNIAFPSGFVVSEAAAKANGDLWIRGGSINGPGAVWRYSAGEWMEIQPKFTPAGGSETSVGYASKVVSFDGKWWTIATTADYQRYLVASTDGVDWDVITIAAPGSPGSGRPAGLHRFEDRLALRSSKPGSASAQEITLIAPGGAVETLPFAGDVRKILRVDNANYWNGLVSGVGTFTYRVRDGEGIAEKLPLFEGISSVFEMSEGVNIGGTLVGVSAAPDSVGGMGGKLLTGVFERTIRSKSLGFSSYAKSGSKWFLGYPDGTIWQGTDLKTAPVAGSLGQRPNPTLSTYKDEFVFGDMHSSDGSRWRKLGAAFGPFSAISRVEPLGQIGDRFLHSLETSSRSPLERSFQDVMFPNANLRTNARELNGPFYRGQSDLIQHLTLGGNPNSQITLVKESAGIAEISTPDIGFSHHQITYAENLNGRWYLRADGSGFDNSRLLVSSNGTDWQTAALPKSCVVGGRDGHFLAIENNISGYVSTDGIGWAPVTFSGLPSASGPSSLANLVKIVHYQGFFLAQYLNRLYASEDGISWAVASASLPISAISQNDHSLLAVTTSGALLEPGGQSGNGPYIEMASTLESVAVPFGDAADYHLDVSDADGDLVEVRCYLDGMLHSVVLDAPFDFTIQAETYGLRAVEFVAVDSEGRKSRATAKLDVRAATASAHDFVIGRDFSDAVYFKGKYYQTFGSPEKAVFVWEKEDRWVNVTPLGYSVGSLVAGGDTLLLSTAQGVLRTRDGLKWEFYGGFGTEWSSADIPSIQYREGRFELFFSGYLWSSEDGQSWEKSSYPHEFDPIAVTWTNDGHGFIGFSKGFYVTEDGGRTWLKLAGEYDPVSSVMPVKDGFMIRNSSSLYLVRRGDLEPVELDSDAAYPNLVSLLEMGGLKFIVKQGEYLRTTEDGLNFVEHTPLPSTSASVFRRLGNTWISVSDDGIYASADLRTWNLLKEFAKSGSSTGSGSSLYFPGVRAYGPDALEVRLSRFPTKKWIIASDLSISESSSYQAPIQSPLPSVAQGVRFKGHWLTAGGWFHTKPVGKGVWEPKRLMRSETFVEPVETVWPTGGNGIYSGFDLAAATHSRFIALRQDLFNVGHNFVVTSDDAENFIIHNWNAPIPLPELIGLGASETSFMAIASGGRVLRSDNGLDWTVATVSTTLYLEGVLWFGGKWHVSGIRGYTDTGSGLPEGEVWTSDDGGATWNMTGSQVYTVPRGHDAPRPAFVAGGKGRMYTGTPGWMSSVDGSAWSTDTVFNGMPIFPRGGHQDGVYVGANSSGSYSILDVDTGAVVASRDFGQAKISWLEGRPFVSSISRFEEIVEADPRLTQISVSQATVGVGDVIDVDLTSMELPDAATHIVFALGTDEFFGNEDDVVLGVAAWNGGVAQGADVRRFKFVLPPEIVPGEHRVIASIRFDEAAEDASLWNNQIATKHQPISVPGFELRIAQTGDGTVESQDPRVLYPLGKKVFLQAAPGEGFLFRGWEGSLVSSQAAVELLMDSDKSLSLVFSEGNTVMVRSIGRGTVSGGNGILSLLPGETVSLTQTAAAGWVFDCWTVDGAVSKTQSLEHEPLGNELIEAVFVPDFAALRSNAFGNAGPSVDRSWRSDPDGDGLTTWQEILLGMDPMASSPLEAVVEESQNRLRMVYTRPQGRLNVPWVTAEFSEGLSGWSVADSVRMSERVLRTRDGVETVEVLVPFGAGPSGFFRLKMPSEPVDVVE